jgi:SnoaL-like polyketide cyclase
MKYGIKENLKSLMISSITIAKLFNSDPERRSHQPRVVPKASKFILLNGFPDLKFTIEQMIAEGDRVSTLLVMNGTHAGEWLGIPPNGKHINIRMMTIHRFRNCKIIEDWVVVESLGFFQQLGIVPATSDLLRARLK